MPDLLQKIPKPLLEDIVDNHCIPIIGAGFSKSATLPSGVSMPLWEDLGQAFAKEMGEDYPYSTPTDAISAYCHEFTRVKMIEKLGEFLHIEEAKPGPVHLSFCRMPFDTVVTTNFDFLLEQAYDTVTKYCHLVIAEEGLSVKPPRKSAILLKLHGDLRHPKRLVITEKDYDTFLEKYPLLATYLSNLLISRTPLFIGYSLGDPDFRQVWQVIGDRLGELRRPAYSICLEPSRADIRRFERRGVRVINIKRSSSYSETLTRLFNELREYWSNVTIKTIIPTKEETLKELVLPSQSLTRLCFFLIPYRLQSFYEENVFPIAEAYGLVPLTTEDVVSPAGNPIAKEMALFDRADFVVMDAISATREVSVFALERMQKTGKRVLIVAEPEFEPTELIRLRFSGINTIVRPKDIFVNYERFLLNLENWFKSSSDALLPRLADEPRRLLEMNELRAAFISAMTLFESSLRDFLMRNDLMGREKRPLGLYQMLIRASKRLELPDEEIREVTEWIRKRNLILHQNKGIYRTTATRYVNKILSLTRRIQER